MVNQLPQGWKEEELGKLADVSSGDSAPQSSIYFLNGIYPFCRTSDVGKIHRSSNFSEIEDYVNETAISKLHFFRRGTILFPKSGASTLLNHRVMLSIDSYVSSHLATICANSIDRYYLYYFLCTVDAKQLVPNVDYPSLKISELKNIKVPYPTDKGEQEYIVKTLDAVAEMIKLRKETIDLTKKLIPAIFQEMFGNIRGSEPIKKHVIVNPRKVSLNDDVEVSFFSMADVSVDGYILSSQRRRYSDVRNGFSSFMNDDVILAKITPCYENGKGAIVRDLINGIGFGSTEFYVLRCDKQYILPEYLFYLLRSDDFMELGKCHMKGAAGQKRLDKSFLQNFGIVYPPLPLQKEFADKVEQINQNLEVQQKDLERLQELFDQLLQKAFTGELTRGEDYGKH